MVVANGIFDNIVHVVYIKGGELSYLESHPDNNLQHKANKSNTEGRLLFLLRQVNIILLTKTKMFLIKGGGKNSQQLQSISMTVTVQCRKKK